MTWSKYWLVAQAAIIAVLLVVSTGCEPQFEDDVCETDSDCFPDESCVNERCVVTGVGDAGHDTGTDTGPDADVELNVCGGTEPLDGEPGDPCGPCDLDVLECSDDGNSLVCSGATECPDLDIITQQPTDITSTSAVFHGTIQEFPEDSDLVEVGFCWSTEAGPTLADSTCLALGEVPDQTGPFELSVDGLAAGTLYFVRAYSVDENDDETYGNEIDFVTDAPAPTDVSTEGDADEVVVTWQYTEGATHFEVFANGDSLGDTADGQTAEFADDTAPAGGISAPTDLDASSETDGVHLAWTASQPVDGATVEYTVIAHYPNASSAPSAPADGNRTGLDPTGYEIFIGEGTPDEQDWVDMELAPDSTSHVDDAAPLAAVTAGQARASDGEFADFVRLDLENMEIHDADERTYRIRAVAAGDVKSDASGTVTGGRATGAPQIQWYRTTGDVDDDSAYDELAGATGAPYDDTTAPSDGSIRYYRAEVTADGAEVATSSSDSGFVATTDAGSVSNMAVDDITADSAQLSAQVDDIGDPEADEHGFCFGTDPEPSYPADCENLGVPDAANPDMSYDLTALDPGTTYHARAFIHTSSTGVTSYSNEVSFTTLLAAPEILSVSTNDPAAVTVDWAAVDGADHYELSIDGGTWQTVSTTSYEDDSAPAPTINLGTPTATDGTDGIELDHPAITADDGVSVDYRVRAVDDQGRPSAYSEDSGHRGGGTIHATWEYSADGADPWEDLVVISDVGNPFHLDDTVTADETRHYRVRAIIDDIADTEQYSDEVSQTYTTE